MKVYRCPTNRCAPIFHNHLYFIILLVTFSSISLYGAKQDSPTLGLMAMSSLSYKAFKQTHERAKPITLKALIFHKDNRIHIFI